MTADLHNIETRKNIGAARGLLQSLVPRAQCFCFYNPERRCVWSSDGADDYEVDTFITELPAEIVCGKDPESNLLRRTLNSGRTLLVLPVGADSGDGLGLLVAVFSKNAGKSSWFNPSLLQSILQPAVSVIGENLRISQQLGLAESKALQIEDELQLVYKVDEKIHGTSRSHAGLAQLIGQSGRFLGIAYSVLLLPGKRIRISATHSTWKNVNRKSIDRYIIEALFPQLEGQRGPVIFEIPAVEGSENVNDQGYQAMVCPLTDRSGNLEGVVAQLGRIDRTPFDAANMRFMSHIVRKVEYVIEQSFDAMTGLMNRGGFEAQLHESAKSLSDTSESHQVIYFDLDNLQLVNDTFGRAAGDEVIVRFAQMLEELLPKSAVATRLTGDDFAVLMTHSTVDDAIEFTSRIRDDGHKLRYLQGDKSLQVTVSIGIAGFDLRSGDAGNALTAARIACDSAKDHGRDRVEIYDQDNQSIIRRYDDMHLVSQIQQTLDSDGFELLAQEIASLTGKDDICRFEVLLRMKDSRGNRISSQAFFSAAERYQLMPQVDRWVVSTAIRRLAPHAEYLRQTGAIFAVNLSGQSLGDDDILEFIEEEIVASDIPASSLCFEVTESAAVSNRAKAQSFIDALRKRGCRFSLDDFGAGLSSFAYLKNFHVDTLKIDGSFIRDISENRISESMVAAITQVAKVMELETVAEYVESKKTRTLVAKLGVDFAQGHAVGKPRPLDDVLAELTGEKHVSNA
ncbi:MAG: EAL domain-containing protein [Gammaproteobacteria bacterium]|nr:EAL domain-containing protein [Gammaproteobacteria bacterium]MDH4315086.1 EAL domain-containing protein [Gammaproteobacteria bacterium]MDH5214509.1 EAL domain-containing protein [Gammaproteobacteria bacterium]MDH5500152.1 EAL domain-containing protein [Gammaproteobacteria bacterium]